MKVVIDNNILVHLMRNPTGAALTDPATGKEIDRLPERAQKLLEHIGQNNGRVYIPAPVLTEYLVGVSKESQHMHLQKMQDFSCIEICPFDETAAYECAQIVDDQEKAQLKSDPSATKAKLRVDRQVLAIAISVGADELWTHDKNLITKSNSLKLKLKVKSLADIDPIPTQGNLFSTSPLYVVPRTHEVAPI